MNLKTMAAIGVACVLVGILVGYLYWGPRAARLADELAEVKGQLSAQTERAEQLRQAQARVKELQVNLDLERQRRAQLELIVSEGRK